MNEARAKRILDELQKQGVSQMLLTDPMSIYYLTGVSMAPIERFYALLLRADGHHAYFLNHLFHVPQEVGVEKVWYSDTDPVAEIVAAHLDKNAVLGVDKDLKARFLLPLMEMNAAAGFVNASAAVDITRGVKDAEEQEKMRVASDINDQAMARFKSLIHEGVTEQDAKIAGIAHDRGKGIIVAVNKWDAIEKNDKTIYEFTKKIKDTLSFMQYAEMVFISAVTGQRMNKMFELIDMVRENQTMRIATGVLNEIMTEAVAMQQPPSDKGKRLKLYYMTQVAVKPPTFVIFVNDKELMHFSYVRYLENRIRESFGFKGTALKFLIRERNGKEE